MELEIILFTYLAQSKCLINANSALRKKMHAAYSLLSLFTFDYNLLSATSTWSPTVLIDITIVCIALMTVNMEWRHRNLLELCRTWEKVSHTRNVLVKLG